MTSEAIEEEVSEIPDLKKRLRVEKILSVAQEWIEVDEGIIARMNELTGNGGDAMDSLHVACAERAGVNVFLSTDDMLKKVMSPHSDNIPLRIVNPAAWYEEVTGNESENAA